MNYRTQYEVGESHEYQADILRDGAKVGQLVVHQAINARRDVIHLAQLVVDELNRADEIAALTDELQELKALVSLLSQGNRPQGMIDYDAIPMLRND